MASTTSTRRLTPMTRSMARPIRSAEMISACCRRSAPGRLARQPSTPMVDRPSDAVNQPHDDGQRQRGQQPVDAGANERRRRVAQTVRRGWPTPARGRTAARRPVCAAPRLLASCCVTTISRREPARSSDESVVLGHRDRGIAKAAIADDVVQSLADAIGPELRRIRAGARGHPDDRLAADQHRRGAITVRFGILDGGRRLRRRGGRRGELAREHGRRRAGTAPPAGRPRVLRATLADVVTAGGAASPAVGPAIGRARR